MQPEQKIIAEWIEATRERTGLSYPEWAKRADLGAATTLTRALKDDYQSVTSVKTLHALAQAAGVPSILDFLRGQVGGVPPQAGRPNEEALASLLAAVLPLAR